jgi:hypothetical protein
MTAPDINAAPISFALYFAGEKLRIVPLPYKKKRPILKNWPDLATSDPDQICRWFDDGTAGNYGILTDDLLVVDVDPRDGGNYWLDDHRQRLPETWEFVSGANGVHLVYSSADSDVQKVKPAPGVDLLTGNAQIVGPGSRHPNGRRYTIKIGPDDLATPAPAPSWLVDLVRRRTFCHGPMTIQPPEDLDAYARGRFRFELDLLRGAKPGNRNNTLNRVAFSLGMVAEMGAIPRDYLERVLNEEGRALYDPSECDEREIARTVNSGLKAAEREAS